ncbi:MAG: hypothetical protein IT384_06685 [Deltaproteobacteria bacterium]|nr:hypothetical protein [Deltaproteobacteria bacterium]
MDAGATPDREDAPASQPADRALDPLQAGSGLSWILRHEQTESGQLRVVFALSLPLWRGLRARQRFGLGLILTTLLPPALVAVLFQGLDVPTGMPVEWLIVLLSGGHVFITGALYLTRGTRALMSEAKRDFYLVPLVFIALAALGFAALPHTGRVFFVAGFSIVTLWHHARQNVGVYAFLIRAFRLEPMTGFERALLSYGFLYALFPWLSFLDYPGKSPELIAQLRQVGWLMLVLNTTLLVSCVLRRGVRGSLGFQSFTLVMLGLFFSPMLLFEHPFVAVTASAMAHAVQYFYFVYFAHRYGGVPAEPQPPQSLVRTAVTVACLVALSLLAAQMNLLHPDYLFARTDGLIYGAIVGVNCTHFWVDSKIWRSRAEAVRDFHRRAFAVLER